MISNFKDHTPRLEPSEIKVATLDAISETLNSDLWFSLACIGPVQAGYLGAYQGDISTWAENHWYGIWDYDKEDWIEGWLDFSNPLITDDNAAIYISDLSQLRKIIEMMRIVAEGLPENHEFVAVIWPTTTYDEPGMLSDLNPEGLAQALNYLTCFE